MIVLFFIASVYVGISRYFILRAGPQIYLSVVTDHPMPGEPTRVGIGLPISLLYGLLFFIGLILLALSAWGCEWLICHREARKS